MACMTAPTNLVSFPEFGDVGFMETLKGLYRIRAGQVRLTLQMSYRDYVFVYFICLGILSRNPSNNGRLCSFARLNISLCSINIINVAESIDDDNLFSGCAMSSLICSLLVMSIANNSCKIGRKLIDL